MVYRENIILHKRGLGVNRSMRLLKNRLKNSATKIFHIGQRIGLDILPRHFYSEIPNIHKLKQTEVWRKPYSMSGVNGADIENQFSFFKSVISPALTQQLQSTQIHATAVSANGCDGYGVIESDFLFAWLLKHRPARIIQIGCGVSTSVCLQAAQTAHFEPKIVCVEPFPNDFLKVLHQNKKIELIPRPVEELDPSFVDELSAGDLLFVDSTHTLGPAGEVSRIILELLPRLKKGVVVHFHDILFPYDYSVDVLSSAMFFWHESVLLHAFLVGNQRCRLLVSLSMLHHSKKQDLQRFLPNYNPMQNEYGLQKSPGHFPSSAYLEMCCPSSYDTIQV